jgi:predicted transcriptional regulator
MHSKMTERPLDDPMVIKLSRRDLHDARRLLSLLSSGETKVLIEPPELGSSTRIKAHVLQRHAREILANRKRRHDIFGRAIFGEPAWEMLLLLYVAEAGRRQTISRLAELAGASKSTGLRWVDYLEGQGLIRRESHPTDKRAAFVELTDKGKDALELYLSDTLPPND